MQQNKTTRRTFLHQSVAAGTAGVALSATSASSYARVLGAGERIRLGLIGCGGRMNGLANYAKGADENVTVTAICDVWHQKRNQWTDKIGKMFGAKPSAYIDYRKLLAEAGCDAVVIATPAHQHCGQTIDAARAGKHVYVEKPFAPLMESLEPLNKAYDLVKQSGIVIQHGTQGSSAEETLALAEFLKGGKLGKVFRIESTINHYVPYWNRYQGPQKEGETDWPAFLYDKSPRPFDADQHASWMGYQDFSSGPIGGWMAHFSDYVHAVTGCDCPATATAFGGVYAPTSDPRRTAPDNVCVILEYAEGFYTQFVTHFGSSLNTETTFFMAEKGLVQSRFGHWPGNPVYSSKGVDDKIPETKLLDHDPPYPGTAHMADWFHAIRHGGPTHADMEMGYRQGIAIVMGDAAWRLGRKVRFDRQDRQVRPA
jgi:predicted dehydrogenase